MLALPASAATPRLLGTVTQRSVVSITNNAGVPTARLRAGKYLILVKDQSQKCNFRLQGPGLDRATGIRWTGQATWSVTLVRGTYRYSCDLAARKRKLTVD